jgi:hypothetical protein
MESEPITEEQLEELNEESLLQQTSYPYPEQQTKESQFRFFKYLIALKDSSKIGNLTTEELGLLPIAVRRWQDIALYAESEGLDTVSDYLQAKAEIILATSLSKKGFLVELFNTQIKREKKEKPTKEEKKGWFQKKNQEE